MSKRIDLTNKQCGDWKILSFVGDKGHKWLCRCKCGNIQKVNGSSLRNGKSSRCFTCFIKEEKIVDLTNKIFNYWSVLEYAQNSKWICRCVCGNVKAIDSYGLQSGHSKSCGCQKNKFDIKKFLFNRAKIGAKKRDIEFNISEDYIFSILEKQEYKCALSGLKIKLGVLKNHSMIEENTASIDRISSSLGYVESNIQWVHKDLNLMKLDFSQKEFVDWCKVVAVYNK